MVVFVLNTKRLEVLDVLISKAIYPVFSRDSRLFCAQHCGGTVSVVGTNVVALITVQFLVSNPDIRLYLFQQVTEMNRAI